MRLVQIIQSPHGQSFDGFAAEYDRFASLAEPIHREWVFRSLPDRGRRALDVGCGSGRFTALLAERFDHVVGIDISELLIEIARSKRSRPNVEYQVRDLTVFDDTLGFDLIFSSTTLHHVPELSVALAHLRGLLAPGGTVMLIDNVAPRPHVARWRHVAGAMRRFPHAVSRLGLPDAAWLLKFETGKAWLDHLDSDRYLTPGQFEEIYGRVYPGGRFIDIAYLRALIWRDLS